MITTRPATPGDSRSKVALDHSSNNHEVASPCRNSEINYPTFVGDSNYVRPGVYWGGLAMAVLRAMRLS
jgi:hypothetical protein